MADTVGTPKKVVIDGVPFDAMADANFSQMNAKFENEGVPTSGRTLQKKVARVQKVESVTLASNAQEEALLRDFAERTDTYPLSYVDAGNNVYRTTGFITFESRETETGTSAIQLNATDADGWVPFFS